MNPVLPTFDFTLLLWKIITSALPEKLHFTLTVIAPYGWAILNERVAPSVLYWDLHYICIQGASLPVTGLDS